MIKILLLISITFIINGCVPNEPKPCKAVPCTKTETPMPTLPTYKAPIKSKLTPPINLGNGRYSILIEDLEGMAINNIKLWDIYFKYTKVNVEFNKTYHK